MPRDLARLSVRVALPLVAIPLTVMSCDSRITGPDVCEQLVVVDPVGVSPLPTDGRSLIVVPKSGYAASTSENPDYALSWIKSTPDTFFPVRAATMQDPFTVWPPVVTEASQLVPTAVSQMVASSDRGPGLLIDGHRLFLAGQDAQDVTIPTGNDLNPFALFAANLGTRTFIAVLRSHEEGSAVSAEYAISSFEETTRFEEVVPAGCSIAALAAASPRPVDGDERAGILVGLALPADPVEGCTTFAASTTVAIEVYTLPKNRTHASDHTSAARIDAGATLDGLAMVPAPFGAWVVMGTIEGQTRPIRAVKIDANGAVLDAPVLITLSRQTSDPSKFSATRIGDDLAIAWMKEASTPMTAAIQLVHPDGTFGAKQEVDVGDEQTFVSEVHVTGSPDRRGLLLDWEKPSNDGQSVGVARLDCVSR